MKKITGFASILLMALFMNACGNGTHKNTNVNPNDTIVQNDSDTLEFPKADSYCNDFDGLLTETQQSELDSICRAYEEETTNQIVVATVESIEPYEDIQKYSTALFNEWEIGTKEKNNGLLIVICKNMKQAMLATGYGTQEVLTNDICQTIMDEKMIPEFKNDNYYGGIKAGIIESIAQWK